MLRSTLGGEASRTGSAQSAILCGDVAAPHDPESYWRDIERSRAAHPVIGPITNNIGPCAFWDRPREEPTQVRHDASALIAATNDPRTPYTGSVALRGLLPSSRLVALQGANRHTLYGTYGNACVDDQVNRYLATCRLPAGDRSCVKQGGQSSCGWLRRGGEPASRCRRGVGRRCLRCCRCRAPGPRGRREHTEPRPDSGGPGLCVGSSGRVSRRRRRSRP
ncbi:alpha/beta hydrolase, partial [Streptomyces sp. NPDC002476]|uniref:alpha/beta hydrolase n=1 Tax=Streptomyces sp. NPDC002476 TaxID=3364648 RepID=UPI0036BDF72B